MDICKQYSSDWLVQTVHLGFYVHVRYQAKMWYSVSYTLLNSF